MMKKLVFFPSDPISAYIDKGRTYDFLDDYYNPGGFFDEVYCLSPWGDNDCETIGKIHYIKCSPFSFKKHIQDIKPDVVRGYGGYCCADWISYNKVKGIPFVLSVHDTNPELIHDSIRYADLVICMSEAVKKAVINKVNGVDIEKLIVMPNRIDTDLFKKTNDEVAFSKLNTEYGECKHILHVGRKAEQKNLDTLIKALKYVDTDSNCIFVGQGDATQYKELAKHEGVANRCFFVDRVETNLLPIWYSWCDCMCTPSRWEGFGYVFIEAASCEACIVTSNIGPMNEYLTDNKDAILVNDYENPVAIAKAINKALSGGDAILQIKKNAREVGRAFSKDKIDEQEINIYNKAIGMKPNDNNNYKLYIMHLCSKTKKHMIDFLKGFIEKYKILVA